MITRKIKIGEFFNHFYRSIQNIAPHSQSLFDGVISEGGGWGLHVLLCDTANFERKRKQERNNVVLLFGREIFSKHTSRARFDNSRIKATPHPHRNQLRKFFYVKQNLNCKYTFLIVWALNGIPFAVKSFGKV